MTLLRIIWGDAISAADWNESCLLVPGGHPLRDTGQEGQDGIYTQTHTCTIMYAYMFIYHYTSISMSMNTHATLSLYYFMKYILSFQLSIVYKQVIESLYNLDFPICQMWLTITAS